MPYDPQLAARIRALLADVPLLTEKKMFGGIGWMVGGHMATGAHMDGRLMIRCAKDDFVDYLSESGADGMKRGESYMSGWVLIDPEAVADDAGLERWVGRGRDYAASLPPKKKKRPPPSTALDPGPSPFWPTWPSTTTRRGSTPTATGTTPSCSTPPAPS